MSVDVSERLKQAAGSTFRGPDVEAALRRGGKLRRRRRMLTGVGTLCLLLGVIGVAALVIQQPAGLDLGPITGTDETTAFLEHAAAGDPELWPLRVVYERHYPAGHGGPDDPGGVASWEFVGTSWNNWQVTQLVGSQAGQIVERKQGGRDYFFTGDWDDADGELRVPSQDLSPYWHEPGWSLQEVDLKAVPAANDILDQLGLAPADVRAFATPAVVDCQQEAIADCPDPGRESVRALAHVGSGLLLYRETVHEGEPTFTYVITELTFSDPDAPPEHGRAG